ncbi:uncharacterized protein F4807DRAFT_463755 [Annulohypoxylon truncatum]|uniref:uncharacterized protein n=1 Tax=Annulohypoxylon truncatum TaxID=327061 RepID=UPI0020087566|nr:uncharacterized protein F4807DRAFT_463755 [Annulohypoxylon truncatum]KAI1206268.1 hypothetical protein F4807DRAFT_463755 [Annulohypoxylon truncatum]
MSDYASLKVPELKKLLQEKSLPVTGNKADLIARLQEHDKPKAEPARENEDEIDYSDDDVPTATKSTEPAKAAEPTPAPAEDKPVESSNSEPTKEATESTATADKPAEPEAISEETATAEALKADFSAHLPASNADEEARKRAERAKRFGIVEDEEDKKKTARVERFGVDQSSLAKGLDSALPEKRAPKRGREGGNAEGERGAKRQNPGGRHRGKGRFRGRQGGAPRKEGSSAGPKGKSGIFNDPTEKAKAEARAKRFGGGS